MSTDSGRQPGIELRQIFAESVHFEHRSDSVTLPAHPAPGDLDVQMQVQFRLATDEQSGMLRMLVRTNPESNGHYTFEIVVVALVGVKQGESNMSVTEYAQASAAALLYPFARELVANLTGRGRFGPLWLHPFNFVAGFTGGGTIQPSARSTKAREAKKPAATQPRRRGK